MHCNVKFNHYVGSKYFDQLLLDSLLHLTIIRARKKRKHQPVLARAASIALGIIKDDISSLEL